MGFKKVLLISSPILTGRNKMPYNPPTGIGYIAEVLKQNEIQYDVLDMYFNCGFKDLFNKIKVFKPDLLGISMFTHQYKTGYELLNNIKSEFPDIRIVAGGPHISTLREKALEDCKSIDFGVVLEGENTMIELCQGKGPSKIKGLTFRDGNKISYTGDRDFIKDLDSIPFPKYEKFELARYVEKKIPIVSSRGCPFKCIYCPVKVAIGRKFRARSAESVLEEIQFWYDWGYRDFSFLDDNFTLLAERVYKLCDLIEENKLNGLRLSCPNGVRADQVTRDMLKRMKEVGFVEIAFGVEVGNNTMLEIIKKRERIETIEEAIKNACELGFRVILFFIIGSPGETWTDLEDSFRLAQKYPVFSVRFYHLIPFPNTELFKYVEEKDYFLKPPEEYLNSASGIINDPVFATPELSFQERKKAFAMGEKIHRRMLKRYIKGKFKKLNGIANILSGIITTNIFLTLYWENNKFRKILSKLRKYV